MKKMLLTRIPFLLLIILSSSAKAQLKINSPKFVLPKSAYFEPAIKDFSLLNKIKTELHLYPKTRVDKSHQASPLFYMELNELDLKILKELPGNKATKVITRELSYFHQSPVDNMICIVPGNEIKFHMNTVNPTRAWNYTADNMPNPLFKSGR